MSLVGIDWSHDTLRACHLDADGRVIDRQVSENGLRHAVEHGFEETLFAHIGRWIDADVTLVMATSAAERRGWVETSFLTDTADLQQLLGGATRRRVRGSTLIALPGVARRTTGTTDLMRREALTVLGAAQSEQGLYILPGQRSRWVRAREGRIIDFRTCVGQELLTLMLDGPFAATEPHEGPLNDPAFIDGVTLGYRTRHLMTDLAAARSACILDERSRTAARTHLAGLMIGNEIRESEMTLQAHGEPVILIGDDRQCDPYALALRHLGTRVARRSLDESMVAGFAEIGNLLNASARLPSVGHPAASHGRMAGLSLVRNAPSSTNATPTQSSSVSSRHSQHTEDTKTERPSNPEASEAPRTAEDARTATDTPLSAENTSDTMPLTVVENAAHISGNCSWHQAFSVLPLVALLRRVDPVNVFETAEAVISAGFRILVVSAADDSVEVTVRRLARAFGRDVCIGVADVPGPDWVDIARACGARAILSNSTETTIARRCRKLDIAWIPGIATVTEATTARAHGAEALLLYPAELIEPNVVLALDRALPDGTPLLPSGGMTSTRLLPYIAAGAAGTVVDTALFDNGHAPADISAAAAAFVTTWQRIDRGRRKLAEPRSPQVMEPA